MYLFCAYIYLHVRVSEEREVLEERQRHLLVSLPS